MARLQPDQRARRAGRSKDGAADESREDHGHRLRRGIRELRLQFDWKLAKNGNSGVFYHVVESPKYKEVYFTGPEYQLLDNEGHPTAKNGPDRFSGANYALHAASQNTVHTPGEWNQSRIVVNNGTSEHWLNGVKVVRVRVWTDDWKTRVANSKFKAWPDYGDGEAGRLALQEHGFEVAFRTSKIKRSGQWERTTGSERPEVRPTCRAIAATFLCRAGRRLAYVGRTFRSASEAR
jgi:hypothetical protein